ncbi:MAG: hypothetical protein JXR53_11815 [Bacteroidales bacterium]|nr:hypothetical protein [Bacteroidales bacterium]
MNEYVNQVHESIHKLRKAYGESESIKELFKQCSYFKIPYDTYSVWKDQLEDDSVHIYLGLAEDKILAYFVCAYYDCEEMIGEMTEDHIFETQSLSNIDNEEIGMDCFIDIVEGNMAYSEIATENFRWEIARNSWVQLQSDKVSEDEMLYGLEMPENALINTFFGAEEHPDYVYMLPGLLYNENEEEKISFTMTFWAFVPDSEEGIKSTSNNLIRSCPPFGNRDNFYLSFPNI